jgi:hypothetical protein
VCVGAIARARVRARPSLPLFSLFLSFSLFKSISRSERKRSQNVLFAFLETDRFIVLVSR